MYMHMCAHMHSEPQGGYRKVIFPSSLSYYVEGDCVRATGDPGVWQEITVQSWQLLACLCLCVCRARAGPVAISQRLPHGAVPQP